MLVYILCISCTLIKSDCLYSIVNVEWYLNNIFLIISWRKHLTTLCLAVLKKGINSLCSYVPHQLLRECDFSSVFLLDICRRILLMMFLLSCCIDHVSVQAVCFSSIWRVSLTFETWRWRPFCAFYHMTAVIGTRFPLLPHHTHTDVQSWIIKSIEPCCWPE